MIRFLIFVLLASQSAMAQYSFQAKPSRTSVPVNEPFEVTFTFEGAASGLPTPQPKQLTNLSLIGGPSTSTQTSIINGRVSSSKSFTYILQGTAPGPAVLGAVEIVYQGKRYSTSPLTISIVAAGERTGNERQEVFIQVIPDKRDAYIGEQIVLTYKMYFSTSIFAPEIKELPKATGFWTEEFELPNQLVPRDEIVDGMSYKSIVFRKVALFATTAGELTVDPLTAVVQVERRQASRRGRDPFMDDPFFSLGRRRESVQVSSRALKLNIKPLPDGRPLGEVAVGRFTATARVDKQRVASNDAITLTVQIRGTGNIRTLPVPKISFPPDFETFEPRSTDQIKRGPDRISGTKTLEYVLIPRAAGVQTIPSLSYTFFDPQTKQFEIAETEPLSIEVERGRSSDGSMPFETKREVRSIGQDIAFAKSDQGKLVKTGALPHQSAGFWIAISIPWFALAGFAVFTRRSAVLSRTIPVRRRRVLRNSRRMIDQAEKLVGAGNVEDATRLLIQSVQIILTEWTGLAASTHTTSDWEEQWLSKGQSFDQWQSLRSALDISERARYAGGRPSTADVSASLKSVESVIAQLGNEVEVRS
ncbi:BatD family protein [bacterium]|nr:BatD family protein [bacterium]